MILRRGSGLRSALSVAILASLVFVALAIWGWDLPVEAAIQYLLISLLMIVVLIAAAAMTVGLFKLLQRWSGRR